MCARSRRQSPAGDVKRGSEIQGADRAARNLAGINPGNVAIRRQTLRAAPRHQSSGAAALGYKHFAPARAHRRINHHDAARPSAFSFANANRCGQGGANSARIGIGAALFEIGNSGGVFQSRTLWPEHRRRGRRERDLLWQTSSAFDPAGSDCTQRDSAESDAPRSVD